MAMTKSRLILSLVVLTSIGAVLAVDPDVKESHLTIFFRERKIALNGKKQTLKATNAYSMTTNERLLVEIADPNPVLWLFKSVEIQKTKIDVDGLEEFLKTLAGLAGEKKNEKKVLYDIGPISDELKKELDAISSMKTRMSDYISRCGSIDGLDQLKHDVALEHAGQKGDRLSPIFKKLRHMSDECLQGRCDTNTQAYIAIALARQDELLKLAQLLIDFAADVKAIGEQVSIKEVVYDPANIQSFKVTVSPNSKYDSFKGKNDEARLSSGSVEGGPRLANENEESNGDPETFSIEVRPRHAVTFKVTPAYVFSFIQDREFTAAKAGDKYVVQQSAEEFAAHKVAAMLNMVPSAWSNPDIQGYFQLGFGPEKDRFAFYVGGGISTYKFLSFGAGLAVQQVTELANGLKVGDVLDSADSLKTTTVFKPGAYIQIGVNLTK